MELRIERVVGKDLFTDLHASRPPAKTVPDPRAAPVAAVKSPVCCIRETDRRTDEKTEVPVVMVAMMAMICLSGLRSCDERKWNGCGRK